MASLLVVTGPPGAGKSTVAHALAQRFERSTLVEGDVFFSFVARGYVEPWLTESAEQNEVVTRAAAAAAGRYAAGGYFTVYDGVIGPWLLPTFAEATGLDALDYLVLLPSVERCVARVATREGHGFTDESATRHLHDQFARAGIDPRHVLVEPPEGVEAVVDRALAMLGAGALHHPA